MLTSPVRSFDVFDTSLTRLVGTPGALFHLMGRVLVQRRQWLHGATSFALARIDAEHRARRNTTLQEVTHEAIYRELAYAYDLTPVLVDDLMTLELQLEESLLRAVPATVAAVTEQRQRGGRTMFISDTYFSSDSLRRWLTTFGLASESDSVWASSAVGLTKSTGDLFRHVAVQENLPSSSLHHTGDNHAADVTVPSALGVRTQWFEPGQLTPYERLMDRHIESTGGVSSLLSGASRWLRLSHPATDDRQRVLLHMAAQVGGPVLSAFVIWVLLKARDAGLPRVLFVARDGQVMLRMATFLAKKLGLDLDLRYLYAGRQVVNLAGLRDLDATAMGWIVESATAVTLADVLQRVGLELPDVVDQARRAGLRTEGRLNPEDVRLLPDFLRQPGVAERIHEAAQRQRERVQAYFSAAGLMDGTPCAIVDIGWKGRVFDSIGRIIGEQHARRHWGLYFGLFHRPDPPPPGRQEAFLFDRSIGTPRGVAHDIPRLANLLEIFCQADHGQVLGVREGEDGFMPVLRTEHNDCRPSWDVVYFQDCLAAFARELAVDTRWCEPWPDLRSLCDDLLRALMTTPSFEEAKALGAFLYNDDQSGSSAEAFAAPYRFADVGRTFIEGDLPHKTLMWWMPGAVAMTSPGVYRALRLAKQLAMWRRRGRHAIKNKRLFRSRRIGD